jgi:hypothetical protein
MKTFFVVIFIFLFSTLFAANIQHVQEIAKKAEDLHLYAGQKAIIQWERIFSSKRHLKRYKLDKLPILERQALKRYLIEHAADSEQPILPGL